MMGSLISVRIVTLLFLAHVCFGQLIRFTNTETAVVNCGRLILEWRGGRAPYTLSATEDATLLPQELQAIGTSTATRALWNVQLPADVNSVQVTLTDALGNTAIPKVFRVAAGTDTSCIPTTGLPSSSDTVPASSSSSASSASLPSSSVPSSSVALPSDTAASSSTSAPTTPLSISTPAPPSTSTTIAFSTLSAPSATNAATNNQTGAQQTTGLPTIGIVGIVAASVVGLVAVVFLIFCYVKRIRRKSDPLDTWDGAYDPESVFKVANQNGFNGSDARVVPDTAPLWDPSTSQVPIQGGGWNTGAGTGNAPPQNTAYGQTMYSNGAQYQYR